MTDDADVSRSVSATRDVTSPADAGQTPAGHLWRWELEPVGVGRRAAQTVLGGPRNWYAIRVTIARNTQ